MKKLKCYITFYFLVCSIMLCSGQKPNPNNHYNNTKAEDLKKAEEQKKKEARDAKIDEPKPNISNKPSADGIENVLQLFIDIATKLNDHWTPKAGYLKFQIGTGYESMPIITNNQTLRSSKTDAVRVMNFYTGLKFGFAKNSKISLHFNPFFNYNYTGIIADAGGNFINYGSNAYLAIGQKIIKDKLRKKVFFEVAYINYTGDYSFNGSEEKYGNLNYTNIKAGAGVQLQFVSYNNKETYLRTGVYFSKPSFISLNTLPIMSLGLELNVASAFMINFDYAKNYFVPGNATYRFNTDKSNQNYFNIKLIKNGKIF